VLTVDLNPGGSGSNGLADRLSVGGRADLGGRVVVNVVDPWQPKAGAQSVPILTANGGLSVSALEHPRSAVAQYQLHQPAPGTLHLGYDIHFANADILVATNDNQDAIAGHLHDIYRSQALDPGIARGLIAIEDPGSYARVMNTLGAELAVDNQLVSLLSTIAFNDTLLSCAERAGDYRFFDQGQCGWLRLRGQRFTQRETHDNLGFDADSWQLAGGGQIDVGDAWHLGGALTYEGRNLNVDHSNASSDGSQFQAGVSAKRRWDATELSGSVAIGYGDFDNDRALWPGAALSGTQQMWLFSAQLRASHLIQWGRWSLKPRLDLGVDYLAMDTFDESGTNGLRLRIDSQHDTYFNLQPAIDIATEIETDDGLLLRPKLTLGITQFLGDTRPSVTGRFAGAPGDVTSFTASTGLDRTRFDIAAGVDIFTRQNLMLRAEVFGSISNHSESYGGGLKLGMSF
jgi:outer membrane autotransporter protein